MLEQVPQFYRLNSHAVYDRHGAEVRIKYGIPKLYSLASMFLVGLWLSILFPLALLKVEALQTQNPIFLIVAFFIIWCSLEQIQSLWQNYPFWMKEVALAKKEALSLCFIQTGSTWCILSSERTWEHVNDPAGFVTAYEFFSRKRD